MTSAAERGRRLVSGRWLLPHWAEHRLGGTPLTLAGSGPTFPVPGELRAFRVGALGSPGRALVDSRGMVTAVGREWSLDWWVGGDDRWYFPSREPAVEQRLAAPGVVETVMSVRGGDVRQLVYGAVDRGTGVVVVEVENRSPAPVAVALAVRPFTLGRVGAVHRLALEGSVVAVDGEPAVLLPRRPPGVARSTLAEGDPLDAVVGGELFEEWAGPVEDPAGCASAAFVFPVTHRTALRAAVAVDGRVAGVSTLPGAERVARGWRTLVAQGMRVELPEPRLHATLEATLASLLLLEAEPRHPRDVDTALALWGLRPRVRGWRGRPRRPSKPAWRRVAEVLAHESPVFAQPDVRGARAGAEFAGAVREMLVEERRREVVLLPELPPGWAGAPLEVHGAPTRFGRVSYALRWHGARPALLWESESAVAMRAPGLDPVWRTAERAGEALLAPVNVS